MASYEHAYDLVRAHGEAGWTARLIPLTVGGLIYASSMVMLDSARRKAPVPALARWLLGLGVAATLAANVAHGLGHGVTGAAVAAWPAVALVGSYELLMMVIRSSQVPADGTLGTECDADPLQERTAALFAGQLAADRVPSVRAIRAQLHVGQPRAQRLSRYSATPPSEVTTRGGAHLLTGPEALSWADVARVMSSITGRTIMYDSVSTQARRGQLENAGLAEWRVDLLLGIDELNRHSIYGIPNDSVRELAGHPARNIEDFLRRHRAVITPSFVKVVRARNGVKRAARRMP